jgi:predicted nucleic acid-binding protein
VADLASTIATENGLRTLDAIHVASAIAVGADRFATFDTRQAVAARAVGLTVEGVAADASGDQLGPTG